MELADKELIYCVINKQGEIAQVKAFSGSWYRKSVRTATDKGVLVSEIVVIRTTDTSLTPRTGDMLLDTPLPPGITAVGALANAGGIKIKAVSDNRRGAGAHWKMEAV